MSYILYFVAGLLVGLFMTFIVMKFQRVGVMFVEYSEEKDRDIYHLEVNKPVELWQRKKYITFKVDATKEWKSRQ